MAKKIFYLLLILIVIIAAIIIITIFLPENSKLYEFIFMANTHINNIRNQTVGHFSTSFDNYLQFIPLLILFFLKFRGVKGNLEWKQTFIFILLSVIITQSVVNILKFTTVEIRPDASDFLSFPSGHTTTAFMCASILYFDYNRNQRYSIAIGYLCALGVAALRILNNRHWLFDVIIGAILGFILTYISYLIVIYFFKNKNQSNQK